MKNNLFVATAVLLSATFLSCSVETDSNVISSENTVINASIDSTNDSSEPVENSLDYASDWEAIKELIFNGSTEGLTPFIQGDEVDAANVIANCSEEFVIEKLKATKYNDLLDSDFNGSPAKEFGASIEYYDEEEDVEYGSGISIFLEEAADGLKIIYLLAAG